MAIAQEAITGQVINQAAVTQRAVNARRHGIIMRWWVGMPETDQGLIGFAMFVFVAVVLTFAVLVLRAP